jgi:hypothetical protein
MTAAKAAEGVTVCVLRACRSETVCSAIETGAPRLDCETWVHLFVPLTLSPRQASSLV